MYIKRIYLQDIGPFTQFEFSAEQNADGNPIPIVLVGENGSGKTTALAPIVDALFECAAAHYTDTLPIKGGGGRSWFQIVGMLNTKIGAKGSICVIELEHKSKLHHYFQKSGSVNLAESGAEIILPEVIKKLPLWKDKEGHKVLEISDKIAQDIFETEQHLFYPSSRWEPPHWLNVEAQSGAGFSSKRRITKKTRKAIYVENALDEISNWLPYLLLATRSDFTPVPNANQTNSISYVLNSNLMLAMEAKRVFEQINKILQLVLNDNSARLVWPNSINAHQMMVFREGKVVSRGLEGLSFGQATLFSIFANLLRYQSLSNEPNLTSEKVVGICVIDEIDAHLHIDLQSKALPELMGMFPKVQFIVSSHSPLFVLGMTDKFSADKCRIIDVNRGKVIDAEAYREFQSALDLFTNTLAFEDEVEKRIAAQSKPTVYMEGETDPIYLRAAATLLEYPEILELLDIEWIGAKSEKKGQTFNTGKNAITKAIQFFEANPNSAKNAVLFISDNDHDIPQSSAENLVVLQMPKENRNNKITVGVEALLPSSCITQKFYREKKSKKENGTITTIKEPDKMALCKHVCEIRKNPKDFEGFRPLLVELKNYLDENEMEIGLLDSTGGAPASKT